MLFFLYFNMSEISRVLDVPHLFSKLNFYEASIVKCLLEISEYNENIGRKEILNFYFKILLNLIMTMKSQDMDIDKIYNYFKTSESQLPIDFNNAFFDDLENM